MSLLRLFSPRICAPNVIVGTPLIPSGLNKDRVIFPSPFAQKLPATKFYYPHMKYYFNTTIKVHPCTSCSNTLRIALLLM